MNNYKIIEDCESYWICVDNDGDEFDLCKNCHHDCYGSNPKSYCAGIGCCLGENIFMGEMCTSDPFII